MSTFASSYEVPNGVYNPGQDAVLNMFLDQRTNHYQGLLKMPRTSASKSPKSVKAKVVPKPRKRLNRSLFRTENRPASGEVHLCRYRGTSPLGTELGPLLGTEVHLN